MRKIILTILVLLSYSNIVSAGFADTNITDLNLLNNEPQQSSRVKSITNSCESVNTIRKGRYATENIKKCGFKFQSYGNQIVGELTGNPYAGEKTYCPGAGNVYIFDYDPERNVYVMGEEGSEIKVLDAHSLIYYFKNGPTVLYSYYSSY